MQWLFNSRCRWAQEVPAEPIYVALFLWKRIRDEASLQIVETIVYSVKYFHISENLKDPWDNPVVKNLLETAVRLLNSSKNKKEPITVEQIKGTLMQIWKSFYMF